MIKIIKRSAFLATCLFAVPSFASTSEMNIPEKADAFAPYQASYALFRKGSELGKGHRKLTSTGDGYKLSSSSNIKWLLLSDTRKEDSEFSLVKDIFVPKSYRYERTGTGRDREETIEFSDKNITSVYKNNEKSFRPIQLTFDPLIYQLALRKDLIANKKVLSYHLVRRGNETNYTFERVGTEDVKTPIGRFEAIKLRRVRENSTRNTLIWVAPLLNYSVVKMTQYKDGQEQADLQLNWLHFD
ncbi:DUF3108 domain-containing protein [Psychrobium sp. nBUS_13]|uniref:DUF3108 domain-containing protein n=1 Tax=Psychrobium sp. nBUS_13 TaxID=3395319 RepID=UPI003EB8BE29